ncbi:MAG: hypothetical protein L0Z70_14510 [Chloroflexi bacterium]|nr:hypothetical protein [Chloroflexota bacterium]
MTDSAPEAEFAAQIERLNETLRAGSSANAEMAFGIGCLLGLAPPLIVVFALFLFKVVNLILAAILLVIAALAALGLAILFSYQARANTLKKTYHTQIEPEISKLLAQNGINQLQFDLTSRAILPPDAPLLARLSQPAAPETEEKA